MLEYQATSTATAFDGTGLAEGMTKGASRGGTCFLGVSGFSGNLKMHELVAGGRSNAKQRKAKQSKAKRR
jgi:hypothetical protein